MTVTIRRNTPEALVEDFHAVTQFLERRGAQRIGPSAKSAVRAAEFLLNPRD
jgi:hypothetical protein